MRRLAQWLTRWLGRWTPSLLRALAFRNPTERGRWDILLAITGAPEGRAWLRGLENPSRTRHGFRIHTLSDDLTSDWIKVHGQHEVPTERFILDHLKGDSTFLDIGANIGYFSLLAAWTGRADAIAFEPQRVLAQLLARSAQANRFRREIRVENLALSDAPATMRMTSCPGNTGHAQLVSSEAAQGESVAVVVLDEWLRGRSLLPVSVCKIDTEGAEYRVLRGMAQLLERDRPALVIELIEDHLAAFGSSRAEVRAWLAAHGYRDVTPQYVIPGDPNGYFLRG
jgi:FkbM family methyltransferase